ncbi:MULTISPECIES: DUF4266 domain-containing protein [Shewanella]|uniref:DUF4266 domain-containing protein n=2 Tax=Shewanella TaxID=22 RepID=A0ABM6JJ52_9GAMM|nr:MULTISPECIES: DUF4266 domain-containing protein [Shewanella]ARD21364.1 hypothetical protein SJ2017_1033 [Shewanella japonica]KPZ68717.1 hypothetical protein AN944_03335 [Shewanella sp. P1-14-1]OBT09566.1 hypothetical protein A9267_20670 [Shewanella sp. UCD-FRSSP16_17]GIU47496.1 hypothetical protein TUM4249_00400 [Shewanella sp. KT0246]
MKSSMTKLIMLSAGLSSLLTLSACSSLDIEPWVKPYERQNLADPIMRFGRHPIANMHVAHVLEARESARGAEGTGGGGCGCN